MRDFVKIEIFYWSKFFFIGFLLAVVPMSICLLLFEHVIGIVAYSSYMSGLILCFSYIFYRSEEENE